MRIFLIFLLAAGIAGCGQEQPLRIGFLGGLSGRVADLGIGGRNGAQLAIDLRNKTGGIRGRRIELLAEDDQQDPDTAKHAMARHIERKVEGVIGPMTSAMALAVVPQANEAQLLLVSPTTTTKSLAGKDDYFFRVISTTRDYSQVSADYHVARKGMRRVAAILDTRNRAYTQDWLDDYRAALAARGGEVIRVIEFASGNDLRFADLARQLVDARGDGILILANSVDTALLLQQIRKIDAKVAVACSEWAATERLTELAGKAAEGIVVAQFVDRDGRQPSYTAFRTRYLEQFGMEPGFAGLTGFDAANVLLDALERKAADQTLKQTLLAIRTFSGAQTPIVFDTFGDISRPTFVATVRDGRFVRSD